MSIKASIYHLTQYCYDRAVFISPQIIRLHPAPHSHTKVLSYNLEVTPKPYFVNHQQDLYGNWLSRHVFRESLRELKIEVNLVVDLAVYNPFDFIVEADVIDWPFNYPKEFKEDLQIYLRKEPKGSLLSEWLESINYEQRNTVNFIVEINKRIFQELRYVIRREPGVQTPDETLASGRGSCRDSSWLLVQIFRELGLAARFVSGYLIQFKPDTGAVDSPSGSNQELNELHAWCEVYLPGAGWIGLDPTSGLLARENHIPLAATPHYRNSAPITGTLDFAHVDFSYDIQVKQIE